MRAVLRAACCVAQCALVALLVLAPAGPALADAAVPLKPPGSNLLPAGETRVQMVAETVLIQVLPPSGVHIRADFTLRNQGAAEERMAVRFPLEEPTGMPYPDPQFPQLKNTVIEVAGNTVPWRAIEEPFRQGGPPIHWAAFDVAFPPGQDVRLVVTYDTALTGWGRGSGQGWVTYVLETGAGWYGPIGQADIIVRLPYPAGPENVYPVSGVGFEGSEARWHWENLEPTHESNFSAVLVWPEDWQRVLATRQALAARPSDVQAAIDLAEACRTAGSGNKGFVAIVALADEAQSTLEQALVHAPGSAELHAELASLLMWRLDYRATSDDPGVQRIRAEVDAALALDAKNARALQLREALASHEGYANARATETAQAAQPRPAATPRPSATPLPPTATPSPSPTAMPVPTASPAATGQGGLGAGSGWVYLVLLPSVVLGFIAYVGLRRRR